MSWKMPAPIDLEQLYDTHGQALFRFLMNYTRNEADTRDLLQEVFVKLAKRPELLDGVREPRAFLLRLAHNLALDLTRRRGTRQQNYERLACEIDSVFEAAHSPDEQGFRDALSAALLEIPSDQRSVVHLKLWERLTFEEIAMTLEISPNTAASRYRYGLDKLRELLRPIYEELK